MNNSIILWVHQVNEAVNHIVSILLAQYPKPSYEEKEYNTETIKQVASYRYDLEIELGMRPMPEVYLDPVGYMARTHHTVAQHTQPINPIHTKPTKTEQRAKAIVRNRYRKTTSKPVQNKIFP